MTRLLKGIVTQQGKFLDAQNVSYFQVITIYLQNVTLSSSTDFSESHMSPDFCSVSP